MPRLKKERKGSPQGEQQVLEGVPLTAEGSVDDAPPRMAASLGGGLAGAVAGRAASRVLRRPAYKIARRLGLPGESLLRVIEVAAPLMMSVLASQWARHKQRKQAAGGRGEAPGPVPAKGRKRFRSQPHV